MAKSIKSMLTEALAQNINLDGVKREFYRNKYQDEAFKTKFPITSRHTNTMMEARNAFLAEGAGVLYRLEQGARAS